VAFRRHDAFAGQQHDGIAGKQADEREGDDRYPDECRVSERRGRREESRNIRTAMSLFEKPAARQSAIEPPGHVHTLELVSGILSHKADSRGRFINYARLLGDIDAVEAVKSPSGS
jgi:hypothetical protein